MKHEIFISYSNLDKEKVNLVVSELEGNTMFTPLVIASNRKALIPLTNKVASGIIKAKIILPILTKNSITTQWINQEIGFATALKKKIMPIIDSDLINDLKGFIHKQIDLPYNFQSHSNNAQEQKNFVKQFRILLADLEKEFRSQSIVENIQKKSTIEKSLEKMKKLKVEQEFQQKRKSFIDSAEVLDSAKTEVLNMYDDIETKIKGFKKEGFDFIIEKEEYTPNFILKSGGFSFSIAWKPQNTMSPERAFLYIHLSRGHLSLNPLVYYSPENKPKGLKDTKYTFDINKKEETFWLNIDNKKPYNSTQIVDNCLAWIVDQVTQKRMKNL